MKILKNFVFIMLLTFSFTSMIKAECDDKTISNLKLQADNLEFNYEYIEDLYSDDFDLNIVNRFNIYISGINEQLYINDVSNMRLYTSANVVDSLIKIENIEGGNNLKFEIFSKECDKKLRTVNIKIPFYNIYSENELCLQYSDATPCNKFLDYEMTQERFDKEISVYINKEDNKDSSESLFTKFINVISANFIYIIATIIVVSLVIAVYVINKKRRELN